MQLKPTRLLALLGTLILSLFLPLSTQAQADTVVDEDGGLSKPVWELGVIGAVFNTPEYPGAADNHNNVIISPYVVYRGDVLRIGDGSAARAVAIEKDWIEVDLSLDAAFNADAEQDSARSGMPKLDYVFEIGPQVKLILFKTEKKTKTEQQKLLLKLQARAAFSTDFSSINHRGYIFHPELSYQRTHWLKAEDRLTVNLSPIWATEKLHDYFYQVDSSFVTPVRDQYDARGGYLGFEVSAGYGIDVNDNIRLFFGGSVKLHQGSANQDSPLFFDKNNYSIAAGLIWRIHASEQRRKVNVSGNRNRIQ